MPISFPAVADRDGLPRAGAEQPIERCDESGDVGAAHVSRKPVGGGAAALDGNDPVDTLAAPQVDYRFDAAIRGHGVYRDVSRTRGVERTPASGLTDRVRCEAADQSISNEAARHQRCSGGSVSLGGRRIAAWNKKTGDQSDPGLRACGQRLGRTAQAAPRRLKDGAHAATDIAVNGGFEPVDQSYRAAKEVFRRSVISIAPGAWVMQNSGRTWAITAWGVTPQAQNTGSSSAPIGTASP